MSQAISNTSPLTNLAVIGQLDLVQAQLTSVTVPEAVWREMMALPHRYGRSALLAANNAGWLQVAPLVNPIVARDLRLGGLDDGEAEAIALAVERTAPLLLIDEKKGRTEARRLGIRVAGALAIVATARRNGAIPSAKVQIDRLRTEAGFFISAEVEAHTLRLAGEP